MLKRSMLLAACALIVLAVGGSTTPAEAHCVEVGPHSGDHPHCSGGGDGKGGGEYEVTVSGDLSFAETLTGVDGGGRREPVNIFYQFPELDLSFFFDKFGGAGNLDGQRCFAGADWASLGSAISIHQEKDGSAKVRYWFIGFGRDGTTPVEYLLATHGGFDDPTKWPPAAGEEGTTVVITDWRMGTKNKKIENACRSELFTESIVQQITVTRTN